MPITRAGLSKCRIFDRFARRHDRLFFKPTQAGQTHVQHLYNSLLDRSSRPGDDEIGRLDVAMHHAVLMGVLQAECRLPDIIARLHHGQRAEFENQAFEVLALDVLHGKVVDAADLVGVVRQHDVRVHQLGRRLGLTIESRHSLRVGHFSLRISFRATVRAWGHEPP